MSMRRQGEMVAETVGKEPNLLGVPIGIFNVIVNGLQGSADLCRKLQGARFCLC